LGINIAIIVSFIIGHDKEKDTVIWLFVPAIYDVW